MKGDRVEIVVDAGDTTRTYEVIASRAGRRVETAVRRGVVEVSEVTRNELRAVVDEELSQLPEKYRAPLMLCYLEGRTQEEAARTLGWSKSTIRRRLGRGLELLRVRLTRRGTALSDVSLPGSAGVPAGLAASTFTR